MTPKPFKSKFELPRFIAGVDPDTKASGLVIFDRQQKQFVLLKCLTDPALQQHIITTYQPADILIVVEAGWLNGGLFHGKDTAGWDPRKAKAYGAAIAKSVGRNFEVGHALLHVLKANNYQTDTYRPAGPKWKAPLFMRLTKLPRGYNPEIRDSVRAMWDYISDCFP